MYNAQSNPNAKSKTTSGLLALFLGFLGIHNFYLGHTIKALTQLLISVLSGFKLSWLTAIWGLIEGIMIFTGKITTDANGNILKN